MFVYKQYDQAALDLQYNNRLRVPDHADYTERWERSSLEAENNHKGILDIPYGESDREKLDIYPSSQPESKTLIFIHGGYWQRFDKSLFRLIVNGFLPYHITTVLINYPLAPAASMDESVLSCRKAVHWLYQNIHRYNGISDELYIAGHSAGGHLAVMMMAADWCHSNPRYPRHMIKGVCAMSGLFNLLPIQLSEQNEGLKLTDKMVMCNSPVDLHPVCPCPLLLAVGENESQEFIDQSKELYECWKEEDVPVQLIKLPGINHYSIVENAIAVNSALHLAIKQLLKI